MERTSTLLLASALLLGSPPGHALGPDARAGKTLAGPCNVCHDETLDPPKGPPLFAVQRRYKRAYPEREAFIEQMVAFVRRPSRDRAIMTGAVEQLGVMAPMPLPESTLRQIAAYLYEEAFPAPCTHWRIAVRRAEGRGDAAHAAKDRRQLERFCR